MSARTMSGEGRGSAISVIEFVVLTPFSWFG